MGLPSSKQLASFVAPFALVLGSNVVMAHCDTMDGPVVEDARKALEQEEIDPVLKWIPAEDEKEIQSAFDMALEVRDESETAQHVADRYFFETLVRVHRASEGEPFTGLKPAGSVNPAIAAADRALEDGNVDPLADKMAAAVREEIERRFTTAHERAQAADESPEQGREFVAAYVQLTHFLEGLDHILHAGADHLVPHGVGQEEQH